MDHVMSRPHAGQRRFASHLRTIVGAFVAFALSFAALIAMPQAAQAADVVNVPDAGLKAVLNSAIATSTATTRTPDQDISPADALTVTWVESYDDGSGVTVADFTGLTAFTNLTGLYVYNTAETISLEPLAGLSIQSLGLSPVSTGAPGFAGKISSDLSALGSMSSLTQLTLSNYSLSEPQLSTLPQLPTLHELTVQGAGLTGVSFLTKVPNLVLLDVKGNKIKDLSPTSAITGLQRLSAVENSIVDISFLKGMKSLTGINLSSNLIEDVSVFSTFDDSYQLNDTNGNSLNLSKNRIRDFSPVTSFRAIAGNRFSPSVTATGQSIFVGPYDAANGVIVMLKGAPTNAINNAPATPVVSPAGAGTYDPATGRLISADPAAKFLRVNPSWTSVNFSEAPDKLAALRVNEVESDGDAVHGDWVELYNPASTTVDMSGLVIADSDDTHKITVPVGTKIPAQGHTAIRTDDPAVAGQFDLGSGDSVRVFAPGTTDLTTDPIDSYSWTTHATTTYGRTLPGAGRWTTTAGGTFGALNAFATAATVSVTGDAASADGSANLTASVAKPDGTGAATDATGTVVFAVDGKDVSGAVAVTAGRATWKATGLTGSPAGVAHQVTARYIAGGDSDPYDSSVPSAEFTVTVTIGEFAGTVTLSTSTPQVCGTIASDLSGITPAPDSMSYQWQQKPEFGGSWVDVAAATTASHSVAFTVVDGRLVSPSESLRRLVVTVSKAGYATKTFTSAETASVHRVSFVTNPAATLSTSSPKVGETVTATHAKWTTCIPSDLNYEIGYEYQWLRDGQPIAGAYDSVSAAIGGAGPKKVSYTVTAADAGHKISVRVAGSAEGLLNEPAVSTETSAVAAGAFTTSPAPVVDNVSPTVGDTLAATVGAWAPVASMSWQWLRDGQPIDGATSASYTTTAADQGRAISVRVTGTGDGYGPASTTSTATTGVAAKPVVAPPAPAVPGVTQVDRSVSSKYSVKVTAVSGRKLKLSVSAKGVPASAIDKVITVRIAGVKGSYAVTVRNGKATVSLGSKAKSLKKGKKVAVTVSLAKLTAKSSTTAGSTRTTTTYAVAKATKKVKVKLK